MVHNLGPQCDYLHDAPSYQDFLHRYLLTNRPVIIGPSLIAGWRALELWTRPSQVASIDREIDWDALSALYGSEQVTVADCSTRDFSDQKRENRLFREVVDLWKAGEGGSLYVKDWHLARSMPDPSRAISSENVETEFYSTPDIFRDDWMNAYYSSHTTDDFRFVYVGAQGTFTPLHRDVYTSYSWSTNVCGRKRWWFFPPEQAAFLMKKGRHGETAFDVRDVDLSEFPDFDKAKPMIVEQNSGETIFVPSGWYHQVENLTACISINHNWCNAVNLPSLYASMCAKVVEVEHALEDVKELLSGQRTTAHSSPSDDIDWKDEWIRIVQDVVEKDAGWNWLTFWRMVHHATLHAKSAPSPTLSPSRDVLWDPAPPSLTPPLPFIEERVKECLDAFLGREQEEWRRVDGLDKVIRDVQKLME